MKIIMISESQFNKLMEGEGACIPSFNGGNMKKYIGSEVSTTANVTNADGELEFGEQPTSDDFANQQAIQNIFTNGLKNSRVRF